ncbi:thioredoxin-like protein Clot [Lolium rigidum]|uniref:thioredoxin-like protein Clot n=1 Tax=Lolium rigidum TaxID=89674 RepID=UPI001F5CA5B4|nr:thioredoxin-like protein Clot [Lolium rigidum]
MTVTKVDAALDNFEDLFAGHFAAADGAGGSSSNAVKLLLFLADREPSSNLTWCPDCNVAEPVIYSKLDALEGRDVVLLRAFVGDKPTWRDPAHPWRVDPRFRLTGVPTLLRWDASKGEATARLGDDEAGVADKIDALLLD